MVIDHTSYALSDTEGDHTLIATDEFIKSDVILGNKKIEASLILILWVSPIPESLHVFMLKFNPKRALNIWNCFLIDSISQ